MVEQSQNPTLTDGLFKAHTYPKKLRFQERAFSVGNVIGVNAFRINRVVLKQRLLSGGYKVCETPHFLVGTQLGAPTLVVHWFPLKAIDADLGHHFMDELKPLGLLVNPQRFGEVFGAVVGSVFPQDPQRAWHLFGTNTLQRYHHLIAAEMQPPRCDFPVEVFATIYRRVCELCVGESLLDAGCSFGFFPLVIAEQLPGMRNVVGVDIHSEPFPVTRAIAEERHLTNIQFVQADLLTDEMSRFHPFETVTVLHVLEHFTETDMYQVLAHLLKLTMRRLILAVPYESGEAESAYGHEQLFTRAKLESVGQWCIERWGGGQMHCEDCAGGLLYLDRDGA